MIRFTVVTSNKDKLDELHRLIPKHIEFDHHNLDLPEIQSLDLREIITDKAQRAYDILKRPVLVEDVAAGLDALNGLPGPFIKFFNEQLGKDALYKLSNGGGAATVYCTIAYYDGQKLLIGQGQVNGHVGPRRKDGFGFEVVFVPNGYEQTFAEMPDNLKDSLSHRGRAIHDLLPQLDL
jgi:inosine triphosphate pyrophosphatase